MYHSHDRTNKQLIASYHDTYKKTISQSTHRDVKHPGCHPQLHTYYDALHGVHRRWNFFAWWQSWWQKTSFLGNGSWRLCLYYSWAPGCSSTGWQLTSSGYLSCSSFRTVPSFVAYCSLASQQKITAVLTGLIHLAYSQLKAFVKCCACVNFCQCSLIYWINAPL